MAHISLILDTLSIFLSISNKKTKVYVLKELSTLDCLHFLLTRAKANHA